jgi:hypothetical protein
VALATSPEARQLNTPQLRGLKEVVEDCQRNRPWLPVRIIARLRPAALRLLTARFDASEYRLNRRIDTLRTAIEGLNDIESTRRAQETEELKQMTPHARAMYIQLKDAAKRYSRSTHP